MPHTLIQGNGGAHDNCVSHEHICKLYIALYDCTVTGDRPMTIFEPIKLIFDLICLWKSWSICLSCTVYSVCITKLTFSFLFFLVSPVGCGF